MELVGGTPVCFEALQRWSCLIGWKALKTLAWSRQTLLRDRQLQIYELTSHRSPALNLVDS